MYVQQLNSEIFPVLNVAFKAGYRDLSLQNASKMTSIQDSFIIRVIFFTNQLNIHSLYLVFFKLNILKL